MEKKNDNYIRFGVCLRRDLFDALEREVERLGPDVTRNGFIKKLVIEELEKAKREKVKNPAA